mgnify:FL=1
MDKNAVFKNLLFDLDGTLTDPALGITSAAQYALGKMGIEVADRTTLTWLIGPPLIGSFEEGFGMTNLQALEALKHYREYFSEKGIFENQIYPGIAELLSDLKAAGRRVMVATSKPEDFTHRILDHFDIARYFDFVGGNTMDEGRPTKADVIAHVLRSCPDAAPENTLMIGDRKYDAEGARAFGLDCAGVLYGYGSREELEHAGAAYIVESVAALRELLL